MKQLAFGALFIGLVAACGGGDSNNKIKLPDGAVQPMQCDPRAQTGCAANEKCTWLIDAVMPQYVGHVGCAPDGDKNVGDTCAYGAAGASGFDDCKKGGVCTAFLEPGAEGRCKQVCDQQGGAPTCDDQHVCVTYADLFSTGETTPAAAGVCDVACDPLLDSDFDGSNGPLTGSSSVKRSSTCGSADNVGCYGIPSFGTAPATGWSCAGDRRFDSPTPGLRHRVQCIDSNMCTRNGTLFVNSCNQGYIPLLQESSFVSTAVCIALCRPLPCWKDGNCGGAQNLNRIGSANDGCRDTDRVGVSPFNNVDDDDGGEHCTHMWFFEIDGNTFLPSPSSDTVGFCYNHEVYKFDSNLNGMIDGSDASYPNCSDLGSGVGTGSGSNGLTRFGAVNFGCVPSSFIPMAAQGKLPEELIKARAQMDLPRALYRRMMQ